MPAPLLPRLRRALTTLLKYLVFLTTAGFIASILLQIFARLFLPTAPSWTEEAARLFFVLAVGGAAGLALRANEYVYFDFLYRRLSPAWRGRLSLLIDLATVVLFGVFTVEAGRFVVMGWAERSPGLKFPMAVAFAGVFVLGLSVFLYALDRLRGRLFPKAPRS